MANPLRISEKMRQGTLVLYRLSYTTIDFTERLRRGSNPRPLN